MSDYKNEFIRQYRESLKILGVQDLNKKQICVLELILDGTALNTDNERERLLNQHLNPGFQDYILNLPRSGVTSAYEKIMRGIRQIKPEGEPTNQDALTLLREHLINSKKPKGSGPKIKGHVSSHYLRGYLVNLGLIELQY
jgi:hypothetical protein